MIISMASGPGGDFMAITKGKLRQFWFQFHKWIGLILAVAIIPISITGAALVWHDALDEALHPVRFAPIEAAGLAPSAYATAAQKSLPSGDRLSQIRFGEKGQGAVIITAVQAPKNGEGRPARTMVWLNPINAGYIDKAANDAGIIRFMHQLHGSLFIPEWGRAIVGWVGVAMMISALSGMWLWWPTVGSWLRGLRWRRHRNVDTNLHHMMGFWIALPLFVLSLTGAWISFPKFFAPINASIDGKPAEQRVERKPGVKPPPDRAARMRARPLESPVQTVDGAVAKARELSPGTVTQIGWPTDLEPEWSVAIAPSNGKAQTVKIADADGAAKLAKPDTPPSGIARTMRKIHDGTDMGIVWQVIIFLGGILPAALSITGLIMWWRARKWRGDLDTKRKAKRTS